MWYTYSFFGLLIKLQNIVATIFIKFNQKCIKKKQFRFFAISRGRLYHGNFSSYLHQKQDAIEIARATRARQEHEIEQEMVIVERFPASASKASTAKNLLKRIARIELLAVEPPPLQDSAILFFKAFLGCIMSDFLSGCH